MKITLLILLLVLNYSFSLGQIKFTKATSRRLDFSLSNDSSVKALFLSPYAFIVPEGNKNRFKSFIRMDRIKFNNDTMFVYLSDTSFTNNFESFNFQDSLAKMVGVYRYDYILPLEVKSFKFRIAVSGKAHYLKLFHNFSYSEADKKSVKYDLIRIPYSN